MTIISYAKAKYGSSQPPLRLVWAGHEPQDFINFFPEWSSNDIVARTNQEVIKVCPRWHKGTCHRFLDLERATLYSSEKLKIEYFSVWSLTIWWPPTPS